MKYPESLLSEDELIIFDVHHHPVVLFGRGLLFLFFFFLWVGLISSVSFFRETWVLVLGVMFLCIIAVLFIMRITTWTQVNLVLTNERLIYRSGVFTKHTKQILLSRISDVSTSRLILGHLFGYGDLVIELTDKEHVPFFRVPDPERLNTQVTRQVTAKRSGSGDEKRGELAHDVARELNKIQPTSEIQLIPPEREPLYSEIINQMERLGRLRDEGVLTEDEFLKAKESLLKKLHEEP